MIFEHENYILDLTNSNKAILLRDNSLIFMGDGYKAITMLIQGSNNPGPVKEQFNAQLTMREKPKFSKGDDLEALRKQALEDAEKTKSQYKKQKRR